MMYYFDSLAGMAHLVAEQYDRAIELSMRSLRENRLHTPSLRTLVAAFVLTGRLDEARAAMAEGLSLRRAAYVVRSGCPVSDRPGRWRVTTQPSKPRSSYGAFSDTVVLPWTLNVPQAAAMRPWRVR